MNQTNKNYKIRAFVDKWCTWSSDYTWKRHCNVITINAMKNMPFLFLLWIRDELEEIKNLISVSILGWAQFESLLILALSCKRDNYWFFFVLFILFIMLFLFLLVNIVSICSYILHFNSNFDHKLGGRQSSYIARSSFDCRI